MFISEFDELNYTPATSSDHKSDDAIVVAHPVTLVRFTSPIVTVLLVEENVKSKVAWGLMFIDSYCTPTYEY